MSIKNSIITLISDWKHDDFYTGAIKGRILNINPSVNIVDLNNNIPTHNVSQTAFVIGNSCKFFPDNTIHVICVGTELGKNKDYVIISAFNQYFIGTDNGMFGYFFNEVADEIFVIDLIKLKELSGFENSILTFPELNIHAVCAGLLSKGINPSDFCSTKKEINKIIPFLPTIEENSLIGRVLYIDSYSNAITNIGRSFFEEKRKNRKFEIIIKKMNIVISQINKKYSQSGPGELLAVFNSLNLMEIAQYYGKLCQQHNINTDTNIIIKFYDN